jgi:hypothetical protein
MLDHSSIAGWLAGHIVQGMSVGSCKTESVERLTDGKSKIDHVTE